MRALSVLTSTLLLAAIGCGQIVVLGVTEDSAAWSPKRPSMIVGVDQQALGASNPVLGDMDGDGYDDFLILALEPWLNTVSLSSRLYLYYGRPQFPEQISTADADATFHAQGHGATPLGDVNGDGLADFAILHSALQTYEIVLGSRRRFRGDYAPHTSGLVWESPSLSAALTSPLRTPLWLARAGDVNCDGIDDVLITPTQAGGEAGSNATQLVLGRAQLPAGQWDPRWAIASFEASPTEGQIGGTLMPQPFGDLDADGCGDLAASSGVDTFVYYGGPHRFEGRLTEREADAVMKSSDGYPTGIGDLDGDGAADLASSVGEGAGFQLMYGSRQRWSGQQLMAADLTIELAPALQQGVYHVLGVGDISGDGAAELVVGSGMYASDSRGDALLARGAVYALQGTGQRARGTRRLSEKDILMVGPEIQPVTAGAALGKPGLGTSISVAGDVDGDGGRDIITGAPSASDSGAVYLIPSTPRAPD